MDDLVILLIYVLIIVAGTIASAVQAKKKRQQKATGNLLKEKDKSQNHNDQYDFGPFSDIFDQPSQKRESPGYKSIEFGPTVEEGGMDVEKSADYAGMTEIAENDEEIAAIKDADVVDEITPEAEKTDVQKWIEKYNMLQQEMEGDDSINEITKDEIVSEEIASEAASKLSEGEPFLDMRKAIIYSEILKRKEF